MRFRVLAAAVLISGLTACQTVQPPATASGRPEITVTGAAPARVKALVLSKMLDKGYRLVKDEAYSLTFEKPSDNFAANVLLSTNAGGIPVVRASFTIAEIGSDVRVVADLALISNAGMAFERRTDVSRGAASPEVQKFLDDVAAEVASGASKKVARR